MKSCHTAFSMPVALAVLGEMSLVLLYAGSGFGEVEGSERRAAIGAYQRAGFRDRFRFMASAEEDDRSGIHTPDAWSRSPSSSSIPLSEQAASFSSSIMTESPPLPIALRASHSEIPRYHCGIMVDRIRRQRAIPENECPFKRARTQRVVGIAPACRAESSRRDEVPVSRLKSTA